MALIELGSGPPALFLHSFPLSGFQWRHVVERLTMYRKCIVPDLLGFGHSQADDGSVVTVLDQVSALVQVLDSMQCESVDIVASGTSLILAQHLVARHPQRVRTLLFTNGESGFSMERPSAWQNAATAARGGVLRLWVEQLLSAEISRKGDRTSGARVYSSDYKVSRESMGEYLHPFRHIRRERVANAHALQLVGSCPKEVEQTLRTLDVPLRLVWGSGDKVYPIAHAELLERIFARSEGTLLVEDANLFWPEELPDLLAQEALRFWRSHGGATLSDS